MIGLEKVCLRKLLGWFPWDSAHLEVQGNCVLLAFNLPASNFEGQRGSGKEGVEGRFKFCK